MILHSTVTDLKAAGLKFRIHLKSHDIWKCRIRGDKNAVSAFPPFIEDPCYDQLAALMQWPSCAEIEGVSEAATESDLQAAVPVPEAVKVKKKS